MASKLQSITKGSQIIDQIFWELFKLLKTEPAMTEIAVARLIKKRALQLGAAGLAFPSIVSFGSSSAEIHHKPAVKKIGRNNFLMLDYGVKVKGFCSDFTRTLFIGQPNKFQAKVYQTVLSAHRAALKQVKIGVDCAVVDLTARNIIARQGFAKHYNHSTGHGVGRKIHEAPSFSAASPSTLSPNLVMTVEPGIYLPHQFGVRVEDMILVSQKPKVFSQVPTDFQSMIISK